MNIKLLEQIRDTIKERPKQFLMKSWFGNYCEADLLASHCGTAACIAGWAITLADSYNNQFDGGKLTKFTNPQEASRQVKYNRIVPSSRASMLLEISQLQADKLFLAHNWPQPFWNKWNELEIESLGLPMLAREEIQVRMANLAVERIDHFIATGE
jgi:hypothetical protein